MRAVDTRRRVNEPSPLSASLPGDTQWPALAAVCVVVLIGAIWGAAYLGAQKRDEQAILAVQRANANLATVVAEHTKRTLLDLDQVANLAKARYEERGAKFDADRFVREVGFDGAFVLAMIIVDEHGRRMTASADMPPMSFADRPYFQRHRAEKLGHSIVSPPVFGRLKARWVVPVSWRIDKPDGSFGGMISMGVNPYHFTDLYQRIDLGKRAIVCLVGSDGIVRARLSDNETTFGQDIAGAPTLAVSVRDGHGSLIHDARVDGVTRVYSFKRIEGFPLHVIVGSALDSVLQASRAERRKDYRNAAGASVGILVMTSLFAVLKRRQRRSDRALAIAQSDLKESHDRLNLALTHASMAVWEWSLKDDRLVHTDELSRLLGRGTADRIATRALWLEHVYAPDRARVEAAIRECLEGRREFNVEYRVCGNDGRLLWVHDRGAVTATSDGQPSVVSGIVQDVSARNAAALAQRESEQRFRVLVETMEDIFWIASPNLDQIHYLSPAFRRTLGLEADVLYADPGRWRDLVHPEDLDIAHAFIAQQLRNEPAECELRMQPARGAFRWMLVRSVPWRDARGTPLVAGVVEDVTERKHASEQRLRDAMRQRDALVMEVHHRIKNHLQGVLGLIEEPRAVDAPTRTLLRTLATRIQSVATVHGLQGRHAGSVVLLDELMQAIADNARSLGDASVDLSVDPPLSAIQIKEREAVPVALILNELAWNAVKYSTDVPPTVRIVAREGGSGVVEISIWNRGELAGNRSDTKGLTSGIGLGLIRSLMPPSGASLSYASPGGGVVAILALSAPVLEFQRVSEAA